MQRIVYLLLIIYLVFSNKGICQNFQLQINGENEKETTILDSISYNKNHIDYNSIKTEIDSLHKRLFTYGYIESSLHEKTKINDSSYLAVFHLKNKYKDIHIYYEEDLIPKSILQKVSNQVFEDYFILAFQNIEKALYAINEEIGNLGFPFSEIQLQNISIKSDYTLKADLMKKSTLKKRQIDKIVLKGYEKFPKSYLKHYLRIKTNKTFNLSEIKSKTESLSELRFANQIKEPEVLFTKDSTILYLYVEKAKSNNFDGFLGFGTNEETDKIDFNGYLNLNLINNLNFGETFNLIYKSDENEQKTFNVKINTPYLFSSPVGAELSLNIFKRDSSFTTVDQTARIYYQVNPRTSLYLGVKNTKSNNLLKEESAAIAIQDYNTNTYNLRFNYIQRQNNRLFNKKILLSIETAYGKRTFLNSSENQTHLSFDAYKIFNLNRKNSAYIRLNGSGLFSDTYLENELTRFGGINSIRGFEENSLSASLFGLINTEYRYQLSNSIYIHTIIDFSYLENKLSSQKEKLYGFGFGFGLLTKAGLLKFNYANGKSEDQKFKFSNSKIHLSLTAIF